METAMKPTSKITKNLLQATKIVALTSTLLTLLLATSRGAKPDTTIPAKPEEHDAQGNPTDYKNPISDGNVGGVPHYHVTICEGTTLKWNPWGSNYRSNEPQSDEAKNRDTTPSAKSGRSHAAASSAGGTDGAVALTGRTEGSTECTVTLKEEDGTVRTLVVLVHVVKCTNDNKGHRGVAAGLAVPNFETLIRDGQIKIDTIGTGETIGHIADFVIQNLTDQPLTCAIPPMILESSSGKNQHYACPKGKTVALKPHDSATVPMDGVCVNRSKPPVGKGVTGDLVTNEGNPTIAQNPNSHMPPKDANKLLRLCASKYDAADRLQKNGALKDLPYHDKQKQKDIVVQWSTWMDPQISEITGAPPATKEDLKKVVYKQVEEQGPVTPDKKKKIDQGIDTIFEKVELTTEKAKDLEKPDPFANVELTGEEGKGERAPENVGMPTPTPQSETGTSTTSTPTPATQEKPAEPKVSKQLEKPCPDGKLVARHAYSECGPDGFWHVVEDAYYNCPPVKAFRVADEVTKQPCGGGQAPPTGLVAPVYKEFEGGSTDCQSPKPTDQFIYVSECVGKVWETKTYRIYECLDGSKRIKSPPESVVRSTTECTKPPPAPPH